MGKVAFNVDGSLSWLKQLFINNKECLPKLTEIVDELSLIEMKTTKYKAKHVNMREVYSRKYEEIEALKEQERAMIQISEVETADMI